MTRFRTGLLALTGLVICAAVAGVVGAGAAIALVRTACNGPAADRADSRLAVHSEALGETLELGVRLPVEYAIEPNRRFPVVWVLDGPSLGEPLFQATQTLARADLAPPAIIVAVPHSGSGRTEDFTPPAALMGSAGGQADRYLRFLLDEAIPAVADAFRTDSVRILVGHSLGGLFVLYSFVESPGVFDALFAFSPSVWVGNQGIVPLFESTLQQPAVPGTFLYASLGSAEGNRMLTGFEAMRAALQAGAPTSLTWRFEITNGADHGNNPILSYPAAARWYWNEH